MITVESFSPYKCTSKVKDELQLGTTRDAISRAETRCATRIAYSGLACVLVKRISHLHKSIHTQVQK